MHGVRCYDNIAPNAKCQRVLVLALCLVDDVDNDDDFTLDCTDHFSSCDRELSPVTLTFEHDLDSIKMPIGQRSCNLIVIVRRDTRTHNGAIALPGRQNKSDSVQLCK